MKSTPAFRALAVAAVALAGLQPALSAAQSDLAAGPWRYRASVYGFLPTFEGTSRYPTGGSSIEVNTSDDFKAAFMGSLDAHNGRWGVFTDFMYLNLGDEKQGSRDFTIGGALPAGTTANLDWDLKGTIWTVAGQYRVVSAPALQLDVLAGARMAHLETSLNYAITGSLGGLPPASRAGSLGHSETLWDGIVGVKGRYVLGDGRWSVPLYLDVGTGSSKLTWQAAAGVAYSFSWGELSLLYRHLAYEMKSGKTLQDVSFSGPQLGVAFSF
ncbi:hypothetical protein WG902_10700 [Ramlibacter sp. PS3R-8]|uniref:hypothetical protein n=1 Tax=Ramlibacter sp. PS3R-8 TaxID=3133437 RepID=UPI0030A8AB1D